VLYEIRISYDGGLFCDGHVRTPKAGQYELEKVKHGISQQLLEKMRHVPTHYIRLKPVAGSDDGYDGESIVMWLDEPIRIR